MTLKFKNIDFIDITKFSQNKLMFLEFLLYIKANIQLTKTQLLNKTCSTHALYKQPILQLTGARTEIN